MKKLRAIAAALLAATMTISMVACSGGSDDDDDDDEAPRHKDKTSSSSAVSDSSSEASEGGSSAASSEGESSGNMSQFIDSDGREYGKTYTGGMGERLQNSFFALTVTDAFRLSTVGGYEPTNDGYSYVAVCVKAENTFTDSIPIGTFDYVLRWGTGNDESFDAYTVGDVDTGYSFACFPDNATLAVGTTTTGYVFFEAPKNAKNLELVYKEVWDDEFEGNTYIITIGNPDFYAGDITPGGSGGGSEGSSEGSVYNGNVGDTMRSPLVEFCVKSAKKSTQIGGVTPDEGECFIEALITVKNISGQSIPMGADWFFIATDYTKSEDFTNWDYSYNKVNDVLGNDYMPDEITLAPGETLTGIVVFDRKANDTGDISIVYYDYLDDDTIGADDFVIHLKLN